MIHVWLFSLLFGSANRPSLVHFVNRFYGFPLELFVEVGGLIAIKATSSCHPLEPIVYSFDETGWPIDVLYSLGVHFLSFDKQIQRVLIVPDYQIQRLAHRAYGQ